MRSRTPEPASQDSITNYFPRIRHHGQHSDAVAQNVSSNNLEHSHGLVPPSHARSLSTGDFTDSASETRSSSTGSENHSLTNHRSVSTLPISFQRGLSDLSLNDDNVVQTPYDPYSEDEPDATFFEPEFQSYLRRGLDIAGEAATSLESCQRVEEPQPDVDRLCKDATQIKSFKPSGTRTIAVLGDSGDGKSSLVNSLLHCPGIAKSSDSGSACTSVVTEFHQRKQHHAAPFTIEAEYLSDSDIGEYLEELVWSYRQFYMIEWKEGDKDYGRREVESEVAWSALNAAFGDRGSLRSLFGDDSKEGLKGVKDTLSEWCGDLAWPEGSDGGIWTSTAESADECCDKTEVFMNDKLWPFTKVIRIYLDARVLDSGVVIADLPGLQDVNLAKVRATERYLFKCDHVFVVARISRAISNQSLKTTLLRTLKNHIPNDWEQLTGRYMNFSIICTNAEEIDVESSRRDFCGPGKPLSKTALSGLDQEIKLAIRRSDTRLEEKLEQQQRALLRPVRNQHVIAGLQRAYAKLVPGGHLPVFCVSNKDYKKSYRRNDIEVVTASGIPALRRFCISKTAEAQLLEAKHALQFSLLSLLNSMTLYVANFDAHADTRSEAVKVDILLDIQTLASGVTGNVGQFKAEIAGEYRDGLYSMLDHRIRDWEVKARKTASVWMETWGYPSFDAFCRNNGTHTTYAVGEHRWNRDLIWSMRAELAQSWDWLEQDVPRLFDELLAKLLEDFQKLSDCIGESRIPQELATMLIAGVELKEKDTSFIISNCRESFLQGLNTIRREASEDTPSSYVLRQMVPFYRAAAQDRGMGKMRRQHAQVEQGIRELFPGMAVLIKMALDDLLDTSTAKLDADLQVVVDSMRVDFEMAYVPSAVVVDERDRERKEALRGVVERLRGKNEELQVGLKGFLAEGNEGVERASAESEAVGEGVRSTGASSEDLGWEVASSEEASSGEESL